MVGTVTSDLTTISLCETPFTGWTNIAIRGRNLTLINRILEFLDLDEETNENE